MGELLQIKSDIKDSLIKDIGLAFHKTKENIAFDSDKSSLLLHVEMEFNELRNKIIKGVISDHEANLVRSKIAERFIFLIDSLEERDLKRWEGNRKSVIRKYVKGLILYRIPEYMQVGLEEKCIVRIAKDKNTLLEDIDEGATDVIKAIRTAEVMSVEVIDPNQKISFELRSYSEKIQFIDKLDYTEWSFYIMPSIIGEFSILLKILVLEIKNGKERKKEIILEEKIVVTAEQREKYHVGYKKVDNFEFFVPLLIPISPSVVNKIQSSNQSILKVSNISKNTYFFTLGFIALLVGGYFILLGDENGNGEKDDYRTVEEVKLKNDLPSVKGKDSSDSIFTKVKPTIASTEIEHSTNLKIDTLSSFSTGKKNDETIRENRMEFDTIYHSDTSSYMLDQKAIGLITKDTVKSESSLLDDVTIEFKDSTDKYVFKEDNLYESESSISLVDPVNELVIGDISVIATYRKIPKSRNRIPNGYSIITRRVTKIVNPRKIKALKIYANSVLKLNEECYNEKKQAKWTKSRDIEMKDDSFYLKIEIYQETELFIKDSIEYSYHSIVPLRYSESVKRFHTCYINLGKKRFLRGKTYKLLIFDSRSNTAIIDEEFFFQND